MSERSVVEALESADRECTRCGACVGRCEILQHRTRACIGDLARRYLDAGRGIEADGTYDDAGAGATHYVESAACDGIFSQNVAARTRDLSKTFYSVLSCGLCGRCTISCPEGIDAREMFSVLRELFVLAGQCNGAGFESLQMDRQWNLFSAYRAIYGIGYGDYPQLGRIEPCSKPEQTNPRVLFFPGCTLATYSPSLTRKVFDFIVQNENGGRNSGGDFDCGSERADGGAVVFTEECCGSPLVSAGYLDRAKQLRNSLVEKARQIGVKKVVCACPGCMEALESSPGAEFMDFVSLPAYLLEAGMRMDAEKTASAGRLTPFDSCHDRDGRFGNPLRELLEGAELSEMNHHGCDTLCCGAGGSCSLVDPDVVAGRTQQVIDECAETGACAIVSACPTCSYTLYSHMSQNQQPDAIGQISYLEILFGEDIGWEDVFSKLAGMWTGEYGEWAACVLSQGMNENVEPREYC